jgi:hypothetical protein
MTALTNLISGCQDVTPFENRPEHRPSAMSIRENEYVRCTSVQSINQSINNKSIKNLKKKLYVFSLLFSRKWR